jgi:hypothetical protein
MLVDSVVSGLDDASRGGALVNFVMATVSVFPDLDLVGIAGSIDPAVDSMLAAIFINPSMKLMSTTFNIEIVENFVRLSIFDPGPDALGLAGNAWDLRDLGFSGSFRFRSNWGFTSERRSSFRKRGILASDSMTTGCSQEKGNDNECFHGIYISISGKFRLELEMILQWYKLEAAAEQSISNVEILIPK